MDFLPSDWKSTNDLITDSLSLDLSKKQTTETQNNDMTGKCPGDKVTVDELLCFILLKRLMTNKPHITHTT